MARWLDTISEYYCLFPTATHACSCGDFVQVLSFGRVRIVLHESSLRKKFVSDLGCSANVDNCIIINCSSCLQRVRFEALMAPSITIFSRMLHLVVW
jgi:hypothetical protein